MVNLDEEIELHMDKRTIQLPLRNILRLSMLYLTEMRAEWHMKTGSANIQDFWRWIEDKLDLGSDKFVMK